MKDYAGSVSKIGDVAPPLPAPSGVYLFASFDLVNSTADKGGPSTRPVKVPSFYDNAVSEYKDKLDVNDPGTALWKYQGDEILFHSRVTGFPHLGRLTEHAFEALTSLSGFVENLTLKDPIRLSVKGTC